MYSYHLCTIREAGNTGHKPRTALAGDPEKAESSTAAKISGGQLLCRSSENGGVYPLESIPTPLSIFPRICSHTHGL